MGSNERMQGIVLASVLASCLVAQQPVAQERSGDVAYISGGVGQEERAAMAAVRADYNLRLTFATRRSGEMRADVALAIGDGKHGQMLALDRAGPQVYAQLPPGTYQVVATAGDKVQRRTVTLGRNGARELYFYWDDEEPATASR